MHLLDFYRGLLYLFSFKASPICWKFSFVDEEEKPAEYGYIKVWGFKWLDNGHQRTAITYVPVSETKEYYPMTEYAMMYWWSTPINMELTENTYARMNFRFEENIYTEEGKTTKPPKS